MGTIGYNAHIEDLGRGDSFRYERLTSVHTVSKSTLSVDGSVVYLEYADGDRNTVSPHIRVFRVSEAPRCECGMRFENCEAGCPEPEWMVEL